MASRLAPSGRPSGPGCMRGRGWHGHDVARGVEGRRLTPRRGVRSLGRAGSPRTLGPPRSVQGPYTGGIGGRHVARPAATSMAPECKPDARVLVFIWCSPF
jgi:hypothetical protein